ncbi:unnamed protein product, partial [Coccothraustes coccothraustes]
ASGGPGAPREPRAVLQWRLRELRQRLRLFPLTGLSGRLSRRVLAVSLHTSCRGRLLDSFPLELRAGPEFREWRLGRHGLPPFIPLAGLARQFLPGKPREFLARLLQLLNAFVARREQLRQLQKVPPKIPKVLAKTPPKIPKVSPKIPAQDSQIPPQNSH